MKLIPFKKFKIFHLLLAIVLLAFVLASAVEQQSVIGQSETQSPDGKWSLDLKLVKYSTLFWSRKVLSTRMYHESNDDWDVSTSIPRNDADAKTIGNEDQKYPVTWSDDSTTVNYWINSDLEDSMKIEIDNGRFKFKRDLYSLSVTHTPAGNNESTSSGVDQ